jgi:hypothetical protein
VTAPDPVQAEFILVAVSSCKKQRKILEVSNCTGKRGPMKVISVIVVLAISLVLGGCFASIINAYSGQDTTLRGNDILTSTPANVPVSPDGGGGGAGG